MLKREAFGKTLFEQPVVRHRLAKAGTLLESQSAWNEQFVYQMVNMKKEDADVELGGLTAAAKANAAIVLKECADCAVLLFGGNGMCSSCLRCICSDCNPLTMCSQDTHAPAKARSRSECGEKSTETGFREAQRMSCSISWYDSWARTTRRS